MVRQLLRNGQVTLPKEAVELFHLVPGDPLDIKFDPKGIYIKPLVLEEFSDEEYALLAKKLDSLKNTKWKVFKTGKDALTYLDKIIKQK